MPLLQNLIRHGNSWVVVIPAAWIKNLEQEGNKIDKVQIEVDGNITIIPIMKRPPGRLRNIFKPKREVRA